MDYSWDNEDVWIIRITQSDFGRFEQPYLGNGILGARFGKLVVGTDRTPLRTFSRAVYDGGRQLPLPAWNHVFLRVGGVDYTPEHGVHQLVHTLDIRDGAVSLTDHWAYRPGKSVLVRVQLFIPRTFGHASCLSFDVHNLEEDASLTFGLLGGGLAEDYRMAFSRQGEAIIAGDYRTARRDRPVSQAIGWTGAGLKGVRTHSAEDGIEVSAQLEPGEARLELFHFITVGAPGADSRNDAVEGVERLRRLGREALRQASAAEWKRLWANGLAFRCGDREAEKRALVHQFYLLCSLEKEELPLGPLGLSKNEWKGSHMWDTDFWIFRAVLPLWPEYARAFIGYRFKNLEKAKEHARVTGYRGAWYPWMSDEEGQNVTPARYNDELHVNIWIALAAWEYFCVTKDEAYLESVGWPILREIGEFFLSRLEAQRDGCCHLVCVLGPDESVAEGGQLRVNDNFMTNYGVKVLFETVAKAAEMLGMPENPKWKEAAGKMFLASPDAQGIIPEYSGYNGHNIKQADVILAFYPLGYPADGETILKNIDFYRGKNMFNGPMMSAQIASCLLMKIGEKEKGLGLLLDYIRDFSRGPHDILFEWPGNDNSIFLTGIGGELQALIYGYYGADLSTLDTLPRIGETQP